MIYNMSCRVPLACSCRPFRLHSLSLSLSLSLYGVSQNLGYLFGGPYNKDYSILGSILGYPNFGKLPYIYISLSLSLSLFTQALGAQCFTQMTGFTDLPKPLNHLHLLASLPNLASSLKRLPDHVSLKDCRSGL